MNLMTERVQKGLDPLTGLPMVTTGTIRHNSQGHLVDDTGKQVVLDASGRWVYKCAS